MRLLALVLLSLGGLIAQEAWKTPPEPIARIATAAPSPAVQVDPSGKTLLVSEADGQATLADLARPMMRLAGLRFDPERWQSHGVRGASRLSFIDIASGKRTPIQFPAGVRVTATGWSPRGERLAFLVIAESAPPTLWVAELDGTTKRVLERPINAVGGAPYVWLPEGNTILARVIPEGWRAPASARPLPAGPSVQETSGPAGPTRTYQDMLKSPHDEDLFEAYVQSEWVRVDVVGGPAKSLLGPRLWTSVQPSPDGQYLLARRIQRPFSYLLPMNSFPEATEVYDLQGGLVHVVHVAPLQDRIPIEGVPTGPRSVRWLESSAAELTWVEAQDEGDPRKTVEHRDRVFAAEAPFTGTPKLLIALKHRFRGLEALELPGHFFVSEYDRDRRWETTRLVRTDQPEVAPRTVFDRSTKDRYGDPGDPWRRIGAFGRRVIAVEGGALFLNGRGASPKGDRPFLDRVDLASLEKTRLWECGDQLYESVVTLLDGRADSLLIARESPTMPPTWVRRQRANGEETTVFATADPAPEFRGVTKTLLQYKRADGVPLSGTLYLPPNHRPGERLPCFVWAYPEEFNDAQTAGQISGSPHRFTYPRGSSHLLLALAGFAVLDDASMPVIGTPEKGNDNFLDQVVAGAKGAIDHLDQLGIIDPKRVAVGGHSYGAFMTANLLAHCDLFRCGIARSGAYNRTLTPFGFQSERRTYWEAPETYAALSPFAHAPKINEPILLIHGELDANPGTFPIQSERLYQAVKGHGGTARLVMLPLEDHGYAAKESSLHVLAEMIEWLKKHSSSS